MGWFKRIFSNMASSPPTQSNVADTRVDPIAAIGEALQKHSGELQAALTPQRRMEAYSIWRETINTQAHDYTDLMLAHPDREAVIKLEADAIMQAYLNGFMAAQGWITENIAMQSAFLLGRGLRDQVRGLGISLNSVNANLDVVMNEALSKIVKLGLGSAT